MLEHNFQCPYCWKEISMLLDPSITYQVYIRTQSGHSGNVSYNNNEGAAHFTAFEIAG